jgi:hypothetical protein
MKLIEALTQALQDDSDEGQDAGRKIGNVFRFADAHG